MRYSLFFLFALAIIVFACNDDPQQPTEPAYDAARLPGDDRGESSAAGISKVDDTFIILPGKYKITPGTTSYDERCDLFPDQTGAWYARDAGGKIREEMEFSWSYQNRTLKFYDRRKHVVKPNEWKPEWVKLPDEQYNITSGTDSSFTATPSGTATPAIYVRIGPPGKTAGP